MKRLILMLLTLTFIMTAFVACDDKTENSSTAGTTDASSTVELSSDEQNAWGDTSITVGIESESSTDNTSSDKDQGFEDWIPLG